MCNQNKNQLFIIILTICYISLFNHTSYGIEGVWTNINNGLYGGNVQAIKIDSDELNIIYVGTLGAGFYYSTNSGESWTQHNDNLGCWNILSLLVKQNEDTKTIYAGTTNGIYYLEDLNGSWQFYHQALSNCYINLLRDCKSPDRDAFYAGSGNTIKIILPEDYGY